MRDKLVLLAIGLTIGLVIGTVFAPAPATSQGRSQPISISRDGSRTYVLYDNGEVWEFYGTSPGVYFINVSYPGASAVQQKDWTWGRIKSELGEE